MDINEKLRNFELPEYKDVKNIDVLIDAQKMKACHPELKMPKGEQLEIWKMDLAVERFINSIINKVEIETGINYHNI